MMLPRRGNINTCIISVIKLYGPSSAELLFTVIQHSLGMFALDIVYCSSL